MSLFSGRWGRWGGGKPHICQARCECKNSRRCKIIHNELGLFWAVLNVEWLRVNENYKCGIWEEGLGCSNADFEVLRCFQLVSLNLVPDWLLDCKRVTAKCDLQRFGDKWSFFLLSAGSKGIACAMWKPQFLYFIVFCIFILYLWGELWKVAEREMWGCWGKGAADLADGEPEPPWYSVHTMLKSQLLLMKREVRAPKENENTVVKKMPWLWFRPEIG